MSRVSHTSSVVRPPVITSSPPRPLAATDVAPQDTYHRSAASSLPDTKPVAHVLTLKTYIANQNKIYHKAAQEDTVDDSVSSMLGSSCVDLASNVSLSDAYKFNPLLIVPRIQPGDFFKYFFPHFLLFS
jgi:hypothetical protein